MRSFSIGKWDLRPGAAGLEMLLSSARTEPTGAGERLSQLPPDRTL